MTALLTEPAASTLLVLDESGSASLTESQVVRELLAQYAATAVKEGD